MSLSRLLSTARLYLTRTPSGQPVSTARLFSVSTIVKAGYKIKSHSGAKKRWRSLASGHVYKRAKAGHSHLNVTKRPGRINRLGNTAYATEAQTHRLKKVLLPYGSN